MHDEDEDEDDIEVEVEGEEMTQAATNKTVRIKDKAGKYTMGNPIHER